MSDPLHARADEAYTTYTGDASSAARSLALANIAVVWLFAGGLQVDGAKPQQLLDSVQSAHSLEIALLCAAVTLTADLFQYIWGAAAWGFLSRLLDATVRPMPADSAIDREAWKWLFRLGIAEDLEKRLALPATGTTGERQDELHRTLTENSTPPDHVTAALSAIEAPALIAGGTRFFFWLKLASLAVAYPSLMVFLL